MKIPEMLQNTIKPMIKRPSFGQKNQGNGSILLFIKLLRESSELRTFILLGLDLILLLEILLKGTIAYMLLSLLKAHLPSLSI